MVDVATIVAFSDSVPAVQGAGSGGGDGAAETIARCALEDV